MIKKIDDIFFSHCILPPEYESELLFNEVGIMVRFVPKDLGHLRKITLKIQALGIEYTYPQHSREQNIRIDRIQWEMYIRYKVEETTDEFREL